MCPDCRAVMVPEDRPGRRRVHVCPACGRRMEASYAADYPLRLEDYLPGMRRCDVCAHYEPDEGDGGHGD